ncbi:MAG: hypothetical protein ACI8W8_002646 [Rhodothermales bacterium]|jgi:hypothetical protein
MILVGNQRAGAKDLARHLLKTENERVEVHELRGFVSSTLPSSATTPKGADFESTTHREVMIGKREPCNPERIERFRSC